MNAISKILNFLKNLFNGHHTEVGKNAKKIKNTVKNNSGEVTINNDIK